MKDITNNRHATGVMCILVALGLAPSSDCIAASLSAALADGQAGRFDESRKGLMRQAEQLEAETAKADIGMAGRNCAAIGFNLLLAQIAADAISGTLSVDHGRTLFQAANEAGSGNLERAQSLAQSVVKAMPRYSQAHLLLARVLMAKCMQEGTKCDEAVAEYQQALDLDKKLAGAYLDLGLLHKHRGHAKKAIESYECAVAESKNAAAVKVAHLMLAMLFAESEQWASAKAHAQKAKDLGFTGMASRILDEIHRHIPPQP